MLQHMVRALQQDWTRIWKSFAKSWVQKIDRLTMAMRGLFAALLCSLFYFSASATPFTETVPNGNGPIPATYPPVGGTMFVFVGANGNIYYQFVNPSTQFQGFQNTGFPTAFQGNPFQLGPTQNLNCGPTACSTYFGGSIVEGYARLTARDGDACPGNFDFNNVFFEVNGIQVGGFTGPLTERTNRTGTTSIGFENCFRNQGANETSTAWFDLTSNMALLNDILATGSTTPRVRDTDPNDNFWFFRDGDDAIGTPEVAPGISIVKTADKSSYSTVGESINYDFTVHNIGSVTLTNVTVTDAFISEVVTCPQTVLVSDEIMVCTAEHIITQQNIDDDQTFVNMAEVTATPTEGSLGAVSGTLTITGPPADNSMSFTKSADIGTDLEVGDLVTYTYMTQNTGNITLNNVNVTDVHGGTGTLTITPTNVSLAPTQSQTFTGLYTITQEDFDNGVSISNLATGNSTPVRGPITPPTAGETVSFVAPTPSMILTKTASPNTGVAEGNTITYTYVATNNGNVTLNDVTIADVHNGVGTLSAITPSGVSIAPTASQTFTATYVVEQGDVDAGTDITNTATGNATPARGNFTAPTIGEAVTPIAAAPATTITKTASDDTDVVVDDVITYSYAITNSGNVTLTNVSISDAHNGDGTLGTINPASVASLAPGATANFTSLYTVTQGDIDAATDITNTATANATPAAGTYTPSTVDEAVSVAAGTSSMSLNKPAPANADNDGSGSVTLDDVLTYTITMTNTGTLSQTNVVIFDPLTTPDTEVCASVAPGGTCVLTGTYTVDQDDVDAGSIANTAGVNSNLISTPVEDSETVTVAQTSSISTDKPAPSNADNDGSGSITLGDVLTYTVTATNTGTITQTGVVVSDSLITPNTTTCASVAPGDTCVLTGTYTVDQGDVDTGNIFNTGSAVTDDITTPVTEDETTPVAQTSSLSTDKPAPTNADNDGSGSITLDDVLTYTVTVTNSGTITQTGIVVSDNLITPSTTTCASVAPGGTCVLTGTYTVDQDDVDAGSIVNIGSGVSDDVTTPVTEGETTPVAQTSTISTDKPAPTNADNDGSGTVNLNDVLTYMVTATNTGTITQTNIVVSDPLLTPNTTTCASVAPGDTCVLTGTYTVDQDDVDAGSILNTGSAVSDDITTPVTEDETTPVAQTSSLATDKPAPSNADNDGSGSITLDDVLTYTVTVTNTGTITETNVVVTDPLILPTTTTCASVAPGGTCVLTGTYTVDQDDVDTGTIINTAGAVSDDVTTPVEEGETTPVAQTSTISTDKPAPTNADNDGSGSITLNDVLTYTVTVTNTGTITQTNIVVTDPLLTPDSNTCASVAPGATCVLSGTYTVDQDDIDTGSIVNTAGAVSDDITTPVEEGETTPVAQTSTIATDKPAPTNADNDGSGSITLNDVLTYTVTVTNTGTITQENVIVSDSLITPNTTSCASVAPGGTCVLNGTYTVDQDDIDVGSILNTGSAVSDDITTPVTEGETTPVAQTSTIATDKPAPTNADNDGSGSINLNDVLTYTVTATNSGTITQTNVVVSDNLITPNSTTCASVAPGDTCVLTGTYTVDQDDVDAGSIINTGSAVSDDITTPVTEGETTPIVQTSSISTNKPAPSNADNDGSGAVSLNDVLTYTVTVTNTGTITQTNVIVSDSLITPNTASCASVAPGGTCVLTGTYTVDQDDVDAGSVLNTGSAISDDITVPVTEDETTPVAQTSSIITDKPAPTNADNDSSGSVTLNDVLTYTVTATNTGTTTQTNIIVTDTLITPNTTTCASVAPGGTCVLTGTYTVDQDDVDAGAILNTGSAVSDDITTPVTEDENTPVAQTSTIATDKPAPSNADNDGSGSLTLNDVLTYTVTATNTGTITQTNVVISDSLITPNTTTCASVAPGGTCVLTGTYTVDQDDVDAGTIINTGSAVSDDITTPVTEGETTPVAQTSTLATDKPAPTNADNDGSGSITLGDVLTYTVTVTNTGTITQTNVVVSDPLITPSSETCVSVTPGATCVLSGTYTVDQDDIDAGSIINTAGAVSDDITTPVEEGETTPVAQSSTIATDKPAPTNADDDGSGSITLNDVLTYVVTVTNTGTITQTNVIVSDPLITPTTTTCASVAPGATCVLTGTYTVDQDDIDTGSIVNTASAVTDDITTPVTEGETTPVAQSSSIATDKPAPTNADNDGSGSLTLNDVLTYTVTATNTGTITQTNVVVTDTLITPNSITCANVAPGGTCVLTGTYTVDQDDIDAGSIVNTGSAVSDDVTTPVTEGETTPVAQTSTIATDKPAPSNADNDSSGSITLNDILTYTVTATNTGTITQTNVVVTDMLIMPNTETCASVAPGATCVLTGTYAVSQTDIDAGSIFNTGSAVSDDVTTPVTEDETTPVAQTSTLLTDKPAPTNADNDGSGSITLGDVLTYTVTVTNTGTITQNNVIVSDPLITPTTSTCAAVAPGGTCVLAGTYTVDQDDIDTGTIVNTASAVSDEITTPVTEGETTPVAQSSSMATDKPAPTNADNDGSGTITLNDVLTYTVTTTNTGTITQTNVVVSDPLITPSTTSCATVAPGATCALSGTYTVDQDDIDAGTIMNTAGAVSDDITTPVEESETTPVNQTFGLSVDKSSVTADYSAVGDMIDYEYLVTNTGTTTVTTAISVDDDRIVVPFIVNCPALPAGGLAPNGTLTCTASYLVTQADLDAGSVTNTASATDGVSTSPTDQVTVNATQTPAMTLVKTPQETSYAAVGDVLTYEYTVTNTGNVLIADLAVTDDLISTVTCNVSAIGNGDTNLDPTEVVVCTASYTVTQEDLDAGSVTNNASVTGTPPGGTLVDPTTAATVNADQLPVLTMSKSANETVFDAVGDELTYEYTVENTGNVLVSALAVSDDKIPTVTCDVAAIGNNDANLDPTEIVICTASYFVTQDDLDAGEVINNATVTGTPSGGTLVDATAMETVNADQTPAMEVVKTATNVNFELPGDITTYEYVVTNTGNVTITDPITVTDNLVTVNCPGLPAGGLAPTAALTCTASYTVTQADLDIGSVTNLASASDGTTTSPQTSETIPADQNPALSVVKTATTTTFNMVGDVLDYQFDVTNDGNLTLTAGVDIVDDQIGTFSCITGNFVPGSTQSCTASYSVTQADVDAGFVTNQAFAQTGTLVSPPVDVTVNGVQTPGLTFDKRAVTATFTNAGDVLNYEFDVSNSGNQSLNNIVVTDSLIPSVSCPQTTLLPTQNMVCTASYTVTQIDVDAGSVINNAMADALLPDNTPIQMFDSVTVDSDPMPSIGFTKRALNTDFAIAGDILNYEFDVENAGSVTLSNIVITDSIIATVNCPQTILAPTATMICTANYTVTQDDVDDGFVTNDASIAADLPDMSPLTPVVSSVTVNGTVAPAFTVDKQAVDTDYVAVGDVLNYTYLVSNTGNISISNISVSDDLIASISCPATDLAPNTNFTCTAVYTVTQADIDAGSVTNLATATGTPANGSLAPATDTITVNGTQTPELSTVKTALTADFDAVGDTVDYEYVITNSGNVTITSALSITDDKIASVSCPALPMNGLLPTQTLTCTATYVVTQADLDAGQVTNNATSSDGITTSPSVAETVDAVQAPELQIVNTPLSSTYDMPGDVISYTFDVINIGNTTITNPISVNDDRIASVTCPALPPGGLAPGATLQCTATYTVTQADVDAGSITNTAIATDGNVTSAPDMASVVADQMPDLTMVKTPVVINFTMPGDISSYEYVVTNSGNTTVTSPITVTDNLIPTVNCPALPAGGLLPTDSITCTGDYVVTQADLDIGSVTNLATATDGVAIASDPTSATIPVDAQPALTVEKTSTDTSYSTVGDILTYSYTLTNNGNLTLASGIEIIDDKIGTFSCLTANLVPGASDTCTATYSVTQADIDDGEVTNNAYGSHPLTISPPDAVTINATQAPALEMTKTADITSFSAVGDEIAYEYVVTNTGNVTIVAPIAVSDDRIASVNCPALPAGGLLPTQSLTCTATDTVTLADLDAGSIVNIATASDGTTASDPVTETVNADQNFALSVDKVARSNDFAAVGDVLSYEYVVRNDGNVSIVDPVSVTDDKITSVTCPALPAGGLVPGATLTCSADYTVTQTDIDLGSVTNIASAASGRNVSAPATATIDGTQTPDLTILKTAAASTYATAGETVTFNYEVTNAGNVTITNPISVSDDKIATVNCPALPAGGLAPAASLTCSADYVVTQEDIDTGSVTNIATTSDGTTVSGPMSVTLNAVQTPALSIDITPTSVGFNMPGDIVTYEFLVTNAGNVTITDPISVSDDRNPNVICPALPAGGLAPNESIVCTVEYPVTQADIDAGEVVNIATATDGTVVSPQDTATVSANSMPEMVVEKTLISATQYFGPIYDVEYQIDVRNTGNVTLTNVQVEDDLATTLAPSVIFGTPDVTVTGLMSGMANENYDGVSDTDLLGSAANLTVGETATITIDVRVDATIAGPAQGNTAIGTSDVLPAPVPSNDPSVTPDDGTDTNPTSLNIVDTDGDGSPDIFESASTDRDGDGIADSEDYDPTGYFFCEENGNILTGGGITVNGPNGSNAAIGAANDIVIVQDGSNGFFQFYVTAPGQYTMVPTYPSSGVASTDRLPQNVALDATSLLPANPAVLGSSEVGSTGVLADFSEATNSPFYFEFDFEAGDPAVLLNNVPLKNCGVPGVGLAKSLVGEVVVRDDGRQQVNYAFNVENTGETIIQDVQINDDLASVFGAPNYEISRLELVAAPASYTGAVNAGFDGNLATDILDGNGDLLRGETLTVELDVIVNPQTPGEFVNTATVSATAPLDGAVIEGSASATVELAPASDASQLRVVKTAQPRTVQIGDPVLYTVSVTNESASTMSDLQIVDRIPFGFAYIPGTAMLTKGTDILAQDPDVPGRGVLTWTLDGNQAAPFNTLAANETISVNLRLLAGPNVEFGAHENQAYVESLTTGTRSDVATAVVDYIPEPTFDCTPVIGRVYDDVNHNGYPDDGEPGLPAVRLVTVNGDIITTDEFGRYHIPCAAIADSEKGSNFLLKADNRTYPLGYKTTTENPRVVRATRGKFIKMNFGAAFRPKLRLDVYPDDFDTNGLVSTASERVKTLVENHKDAERAILVYHANEDDSVDQSQAILKHALGYLKTIKNKEMKDIALEASWGDAKAFDPEYDEPVYGQYYDRPVNDNATAAGDENTRKRVSFEGDDLRVAQSTDQNRIGFGAEAGLRSTTDRDEYSDDGRQLPTFAGRRDQGENATKRPGRLLRWIGWGNKTTAYTDGLEIETTVSSLDIKKNLNVQANVVSTETGRFIHAEAYSNYNAFIEKTELRLFDAKKSTRSTPEAIIPISERLGQMELSTALPTHLNYVLRVYDAKDRFDETAPQPLTLGDPENDISLEDWKTQSNTAYGGNALFVDNITVKGGAVRVYGRNVPGDKVSVMRRDIDIDAQGRFVVEELLPTGEQAVEILVAGENETTNKIVRTVDVKTRDHFFVGQIEATIGERVEPDADGETTYEEGRVAFYLRSRLNELWSLTATADTGEADLDNLFDGLNDKDVGQLLRRLDPDRYYPTYGDDSTIEQDAPTSGRFYARVERLDDYALWGNYRTEFNDTEYGRVQRTLYGAKLRWDENGKPTKYGDDRATLTAFIAEGGSRQGRDELRGTGGSVYYLRHGDISIGSEILRVETRDAISGLVLETRRLTYGSDYDMDFIQGRIILNRPLNSTGSDGRLFRDGSQSGNEQTLVVDYEFTPILGEDDDAAVFGARGTRWFGDLLKLGATFNHDTDGGAESDLYEFDATLQFTAGTYLKGEIANTKGAGVETFRSIDGGFSFAAKPRGGLADDESAMAYALEAAADFNELDGINLDGNAYAYWRLREAGFAGYAESANNDITQYGGGFNVNLMEDLSANLRADVSDDQTLGTNSYAEASVNYDLSEKFTLTGGLAFNDDARGNRGTSVGGKAEYKPSEDSSVYVFGQVGLEGRNTRTTDRIGVGGELALSKKIKTGGEVSTGEDGLGVRASVRYHLEEGDEYYLAYDLPLNAQAGSNLGTLNAGARRRYSDALSVYGEERMAFNEAGLNGLTHAYGVDYKPGNWNFGASAEVGKVNDIDRMALSASAGFSDERMQAGVQGEFREDETLSTGDVRKTWLLRTTARYQASDELRVQGKFNLAFSDQASTPSANAAPIDFNKAEFTEASAAVAYRPIWDDRFNLLAKYVYLSDLSPSRQLFNGEALNYRQRSNIISIDGSYDIHQRWTLGAKYGHREGEVTSTRESLDFTASKADLGVIRLDYHATHKWDATLEGRYLDIGGGTITRTGGLAGVYRHMNDNVKLGGGIVWGGIEEEYLAAKESGDIGWFLNVVGKF